MEQEFTKRFDQHQDQHTSAYFLWLSASRWLSITLDLICCLYISAVTWFVTLINVGQGEGGVGLAISTALALTGNMQWGVRQATEMETYMTSVERVIQYSKLPSEANLKSSPKRKPPPNWPSDAALEFKDITVQYSIMDPIVLKGVSFRVMPREKIGIVGRTGVLIETSNNQGRVNPLMLIL